MEMYKALKQLGMETREAKRLAQLIEGANKDELLYMLIFLEGLKMGETLERQARQRKNEIST